MAGKSDEKKTAGKDESKTQETTEQKRVEEEQTPTKVEETGETDVKGAASGSVVGGVHDGDVGLGEEDKDEAEAIVGGEVEGAQGVVSERNLDGDEYDAPYKRLDNTSTLVRTSDSDDPAKDWTAQHAGGERKDEDGNDLEPVALTEVEQVPGQTFRLSELPNRAVVEEAGIDYDNWVAGVPVRADIPNEAPRRGIPA